MVAFRRNTTGATVAEYAIMLFFIIVIAVVGVRVLGLSLQRKFGAADKHMTGQAQTSSAGAQGDNAQAASSAAAAANGDKERADKAKATQDINKDPTAAGGGARSDDGDSQQGGLPFLVKFALLALAIIGFAAAFLAMSKGKPQSS
jgi:Flp pilus assembly pilin Flp